MANGYRCKYEIVTADNNLPGKVMLYEKTGSECFTNKHWHKNLEINYLVRGRMWTMQNNVDRDLGDGDFVVVNSEDVHQTCGKYPEERVKYLVVLFSYNYIKAYFSDFENYTLDVNKNEQAKQRIAQLLKAIVFEVENKGEFSDLKISCAMSQILMILFTKCRVKKANISNREPTDDLEYAKKAIDFIKENFREKISLEDISSYVGLTPTYFSRYFRQSTRKTFKNYLNLVRLEHALLDIQNNSVSETQAALSNGFPSVKSFIAVFKSVYGCAPSEYVKIYHEIPPISEIRKI
ncbi:MAG: AraC family transcriptional regulator [Eubacteriales bacterium]|nr:AraC family transcriptional regulator [Eubacteriales bacterium]